MGYPAVVNQMLDRFAAMGLLKHPEQRDSYANQIVDLVSGTLVRAAGNLPRDELKAEIQSTLDLFVGGAVRAPSRDPLPTA